VVSHVADHWLVVMRTLKFKLFLSDVLETENDIIFVRVNMTAVYAIAKSTRIQEASGVARGTLADRRKTKPR
jgi:hypothetical protein